jgi:two-component system nitrogen regulation sensor histidine kinase NtrY
MPITEQDGQAVGAKPRRRWATRLGPYLVSLAVLSAVATLLVLADFTPISPTNDVVVSLFGANLILIFALIILLIAEAWSLIADLRARTAGARLHIRIVTLFSGIAAIPAILIAITGSLTLERSLNPAMMQDLRGFILSTSEAARFFREAQCRSLLQETELTASDLDRIQPTFVANRALFHNYFEARTKILNFAISALMRRTGEIIERVDNDPNGRIVAPEQSDFDDAAKNEPLCLILDEGRTFVALRQARAFEETYVYAARPIDPFALEFPKQAASLVALYDAYDAHRLNIILAFAIMFALIAIVMLLSASWLGVSFANRLVAPIRRLITAADQVGAGNLQVQVPVKRSEGDLAHLGETFNKMTSELRLQQNRLIAASKLNDDRRLFTEAVLSGVPAAVIGVDGDGRVSVLNSSALRLAEGAGDNPDLVVGKPLSEFFPELNDIVTAARETSQRLIQSQTTLLRQGRERTFNVRVTNEQGATGSLVVTLDDITELVSAQRTAAWADVARRIAHEIKNPLTPIQLSAERLKRKYGRTITQDREVFDQCTDTIVRQVDDIKRMVDEFSSFARMPRATPIEDDLSACVRQVLFLMRVGHPTITFDEHFQHEPVIARFDRRLLSQALTNVVKNAAEAFEGVGVEAPRIDVYLSIDEHQTVVIDIIDNGKGFPTENRQRLLEPYMTTRAEGTGLGLPIVAKILEDHGGGIELLDAPEGRGARVRMHFPQRASDETPQSAEPSATLRRAMQ